MKLLPLIGVFALGAFVGASLFFLFVPHGAPLAQEQPAPLRSGTSEADGTGQTRYANAHYGFSLSYPTELSVAEYPQGSDVLTVVFQKPDEQKGFQVFIIPYAETQISQQRIQADLKGAPMKDAKEVVLAGNIRAVHFSSVAPIIGESSEVWFIHDGYLFEVTSYAADDAWLASILTTLTFTK